MQISDMLNQYNRNTANGAEELKSTQSVARIVSTVREMSAGSVFEGTVNYARNGRVTLALGNGQVISARMEGKVDMQVGTSMFFQVRANDGQTISIRPYSGMGNASNPILLDALTAAQIPVTDRGLTMVDAMMQEQMSIDKQSLLAMMKIVDSNPGANVQTIVQMTKLGMPVTEAMANQFENYLSDRHALLDEMNLVTAQFAEMLGDESLEPETALRLYQQMMDIFTGQESDQMQGTGQQTTAGTQAAGANETQIIGASGAEIQANGASGNGQQTAGAGETQIAGAPGAETQANETAQGIGASGNGQQTVSAGGQTAGMAGAGIPDGTGITVAADQGAAIGDLLSEEQLANLTKTLQNIPALAGNTTIFTGETAEEIYVDTLQDEEIPAAVAMNEEPMDAQAQTEVSLNRNLTATQLLVALQKAISGNGYQEMAGVQRLFAGKEFAALLRDVAEQQWTIKPQELRQSQKVEELYERLEQQINRMETAVRMMGAEQSPTGASALQTAADIRGNIEFMNQMNQIYNYVQLPLKMSGQNANGELYVYSNRKHFTDPDAEVTAFLHLDMEHLGSTDVSVRMQNRQVKTNFYLEDDASYDLLEKHLPILEKRLKNKGYNCQITVTNEKKNVNFTENFLKKGQSQASGKTLHRYSFDVRA